MAGGEPAKLHKAPAPTRQAPKHCRPAPSHGGEKGAESKGQGRRSREAKATNDSIGGHPGKHHAHLTDRGRQRGRETGGKRSQGASDRPRGARRGRGGGDVPGDQRRNPTASPGCLRGKPGETPTPPPRALWGGPGGGGWGGSTPRAQHERRIHPPPVVPLQAGNAQRPLSGPWGTGRGWGEARETPTPRPRALGRVRAGVGGGGGDACDPRGPARRRIHPPSAGSTWQAGIARRPDPALGKVPGGGGGRVRRLRRPGDQHERESIAFRWFPVTGQGNAPAPTRPLEGPGGGEGWGCDAPGDRERRPKRPPWKNVGGREKTDAPTRPLGGRGGGGGATPRGPPRTKSPPQETRGKQGNPQNPGAHPRKGKAGGLQKKTTTRWGAISISGDWARCGSRGGQLYHYYRKYGTQWLDRICIIIVLTLIFGVRLNPSTSHSLPT
ncbi:hypothetical protein GWK47_000623 [Chionoecetes opilio]|uniref:Uncharacterized protein n=1 Tax=Chionoecetes opilio TaxID=41210 RepID=A0A8J4Y5T8_CHIOP|nr:hypothetical protein GWK47_000623 [Chionoecetes opilio]